MDQTAVAAPPKPRAPYHSAHDTLDELGNLPVDWDSYGATPPSDAAIAVARRLLTAVASEDLDAAGEHALPWAIAPLADGGVQLEWRGPGGAVEVEIGPAGDLAYLVERDEATIARSDPGRVTPANEVMRQLARVLAR